MGNNPSVFKGAPNRPVEMVSWQEVQEFIRKLHTMEGGITYRLPTEAEWEYAVRAGSTTAYHFGDNASYLGGVCLV
jgi:formylglycine-generating enzyme required for sulfatase activity